METLILAISAGAVVPALANVIKVYLQSRKSQMKVTIKVRNEDHELVELELNPENADQAEEIIRKFLAQHPPEKPVAGS